MTKAKWVHKRDTLKWNYGNFYNICGQLTWFSSTTKWSETTCPKCLAKRPKKKQAETNVSFELDGKVFVVERTEKGKVVSQEEIAGEVVLKLLVYFLEDALRKKDYLDVAKQENKYCLNCAGLGFTYYRSGRQTECLRCKGTGREKNNSSQ